MSINFACQVYIVWSFVQVQLCRMKLFAAAGKDAEADEVPECSTEWRDACAATLMSTVCIRQP